jgi:hypothetical protein
MVALGMVVLGLVVLGMVQVPLILQHFRQCTVVSLGFKSAYPVSSPFELSFVLFIFNVENSQPKRQS